MRTTGASLPDGLSPRERDCLRLLRDGLETPRAAAGLGISVSTFDKHLTSARRKLGVDSTIQALLLCERARGMRDARHNRIEDEAAGMPDLSDFVADLYARRTFDEAWQVMFGYARRLGTIAITSGVVAEPSGQLTNGARALRITWPDELTAMYSAMGGTKMDPMVPAIIHRTDSFFVDNESIIRGARDLLPRATLAFGETLLDRGMRYMVCQPGRDSATEAPVVVTFVLDPRATDTFRAPQAEPRNMLRAMSSAFWAIVQRNRLLRDESGLTARQAEALTLAARGFSVAETAEHMAVSLRSAEKTLAGARDALGARTTAAAVYRAMVYRAMG